MRPGLSALAGLLLFTACHAHTSTRPHASAALLALPPGDLGRSLSLAQRITVHRGDETHAFDAQLEADPTAVRIAAFAMGQTVARLTWDGATLDETHSTHVPDVITPARILSDVQLAWWPTTSVQHGLPAGYSLTDDGQVRTLLRDGRAVATVTRGQQQPWPTLVLDQRELGYQLTIESQELQ